MYIPLKVLKHGTHFIQITHIKTVHTTWSQLLQDLHTMGTIYNVSTAATPTTHSSDQNDGGHIIAEWKIIAGY